MQDVLPSTARSHMQEFTWVLSVKVGQCQVAAIGQAANLTFESACRLLYAEHSPIAICR